MAAGVRSRNMRTAAAPPGSRLHAASNPAARQADTRSAASAGFQWMICTKDMPCSVRLRPASWLLRGADDGHSFDFNQVIGRRKAFYEEQRAGRRRWSTQEAAANFA